MRKYLSVLGKICEYEENEKMEGNCVLSVFSKFIRSLISRCQLAVFLLLTAFLCLFFMRSSRYKIYTDQLWKLTREVATNEPL